MSRFHTAAVLICSLVIYVSLLTLGITAIFQADFVRAYCGVLGALGWLWAGARQVSGMVQ